MMNFVESGAGWIAARIQTIGAGFDPEVLSLPGGSVIAAFLWLYAGAALRMKRGVPGKPPAAEPIPTAACAGCLGRH